VEAVSPQLNAQLGQITAVGAAAAAADVADYVMIAFAPQPVGPD
jgi:hypothetical protein